MDKKNLNIEEMKKSFDDSSKILDMFYNELKAHSVYTYILLYKIGYNHEGKNNKKYTLWIEEINRPDDKNVKDILSVTEREIPFSEKEIGFIPPIAKPEPKEVITKVNINIPFEAEHNIQIRDIREQLINNPNSDFIIYNGNSYRIEVEKEGNTVNYYFYSPDEYWAYTDRLEEPLLYICKEWNDKEIFNLKSKLVEWTNKDNSTDTKNYLKYLNEVIGKFNKWYEDNGLNKRDFGISELHEFIKGRIRRRINNNLLIKRSLITTHGCEKFIEEKFNKFLPGINQEISIQIIREKNKGASDISYNFEGLAELIDEFLVAEDKRFDDKFSLTNIGTKNKQKIEILTNIKGNLVKDNSNLGKGINNSDNDSFIEPNKISYDKVKKLISGLNIDILEKVDKKNKKGNRKWIHTEGSILIKIEKGLGNDLTSNQKKVARKQIQKYRRELLDK